MLNEPRAVSSMSVISSTRTVTFKQSDNGAMMVLAGEEILGTIPEYEANWITACKIHDDPWYTIGFYIGDVPSKYAPSIARAQRYVPLSDETDLPL